MRYISATLLAFTIIAAAIPASAQFAFGGDDPVYVTSQTATYKGGLTVLSGDVDVRQGPTQILSDEMEIFRDKAQPDASGSLKLGDITRIDATGNFKYVSPQNTVTGDKGVYEKSTSIITVTGNVLLTQPNGVSVSGNILIYDLANKNARFGAAGDRIAFSSQK